MIKFIYPAFLMALAVLLIPLIIHFFHFKRYKTVFFSQVGFLKAVQQDTKKKSDLKKFLILISRILMLVSLVFAFAQPYLPANKLETTNRKQAVAIYLDNSFSMNRQGNNGTLLEKAKAKAISIANAYEPGTEFLLITNDAPPREQIPINRQQVIQRVAGVKESAKSLSVSETINLINNGLSGERSNTQRNIYFLSDFQEHQFDVNKTDWDSLSNYFAVNFISTPTNNLLIDSCWFETPRRKAGQQEKLFVRIKNQSEQTVQNQALRLSINDSLKAIGDLQLEAGEEKIVELNFRNNPAGFHLGKIELDDYPVVYDNSLYFSYKAQTVVKALLVFNPDEQGHRQLEALLSNDPYIQLEKVEERKVQTSQFGEKNLVVLMNLNSLGSGLSQALTNYTKNGGVTCVFPGRAIKQSDYNQFYSLCNAYQLSGLDTTNRRMGSLNYNHPIFNDVFEQEQKNLQLPVIKDHFKLNDTGSERQETLISFVNGEVAVASYEVEKGHLYNFNFPVSGENLNFLSEAVFVPLMYNIALNSLEPQTIYYPIEKIILSEIKKGQVNNSPFEIKPPHSDEKYRVPVLNESANYARLDFSSLITEAGFYELVFGSKTLKELAFNYNRTESLKNSLSTDQLKKELKKVNVASIQVLDSDLPDFEEKVQQLNDGVELWYVFVISALSFIIVETAIIRWMK